MWRFFLVTIVASNMSGCDPDEEDYVRRRIRNGSITIERHHSERDVERIIAHEVQGYREAKNTASRLCVDSSGRSVCLD